MKILFLAALSMVAMKGSTIQVIGSGGSWQPLSTNAYFNNPSGDTGNALQCFTIGNCGQPLLAGIQYWGYPNGSPDLNIRLALDGEITATLLYEGAGPGNINTNALSIGGTSVFTGPDSPGKVTVLTFHKTDTLQFLSGGDGFIFNSQAQLNDGGNGELTNQHFVIFSSPLESNALWIGVEDLTRSQTVPFSFESNPPYTYSGDYNDLFAKLVVTQTVIPPPTSTTPEPTSLMHIGGGLLILGLTRKYMHAPLHDNAS